jgi:hypothetical protein
MWIKTRTLSTQLHSIESRESPHSQQYWYWLSDPNNTLTHLPLSKDISGCTEEALEYWSQVCGAYPIRSPDLSTVRYRFDTVFLHHDLGICFMQPADLVLNRPPIVRGIKGILSYQMQADGEHTRWRLIRQPCMEHFLRLLWSLWSNR